MVARAAGFKMIPPKQEDKTQLERYAQFASHAVMLTLLSMIIRE